MDSDTTTQVDETEAPAIVGEVRLMTDVPIEIDADDSESAPLVRVMRVLDEKPWLAPVALLSLLGLVLLFRRKSRR